MLKANVTIEEIGRDLAMFLSRYIKVNQLILYGSYCYGKPREDSDFDIAVISSDFKDMTVLDKIELFSNASLAVDSRVELKGFAYNEYLNPPKGSFLELVKDKGRVIYS